MTAAQQPGLQYVSVQFKPWDRRGYTYHWEGPPLAVGDKVIVATKDGEQVVTVSSIDVPPPAFETKAIIAIAEQSGGRP
jgi:hypothetical protein